MTQDHHTVAAPPPLIQAAGIGKHFSGVRALSGIDIAIEAGTVHALVGENGAGKSTLGKIIAGVHRPDEGQLLVDGRPVRYRSPHDALKDGIAAIHQEIALVPERQVLENVFLGCESHRAGWADDRQMLERFRELCDRVHLRVDPKARVGTLRLAEQQKVEIMRAMARQARVIVLDEPTAGLAREDIDGLLTAIRSAREHGASLIFVSHALDEVLAVADHVTVLRDGRLVRSRAATQETPDTLIAAMLGPQGAELFQSRAVAQATKVARSAEPRLVVRDVRCANGVDGVSFEVYGGEIVGVAGLAGCGRTELLRTLAGVDPATDGDVLVDGRRVDLSSPRAALRAGVVLVPESRKDEGLHMGLDLASNITMPWVSQFSRRGFERRSATRARVQKALDEFDVRPATSATLMSALSGGNQQKAMFAKWLITTPNVLLIDEPTRGVDIGAKVAIAELIRRLRDQGVAIVVVSSELEELLSLSDRVIVLRQFRVAGQLAGPQISQEAVMRTAFGAQSHRSENGVTAHAGL